MNKLGIDVLTKDKKSLITKLNLVRDTVASDGGEYREDSKYSKVLVDTSMTEGELDEWLYGSDIEYIGTFKVNDVDGEGSDY